MSWVRVDDNITFHRKVVHCGNEAFGAWMRMVAWSANHLTDGAIPHRIAMLIAEKERVLHVLLDVGLLDVVGPPLDGYKVHDYHEHNPKADDVRAKRRAESERKAAGRAQQGRDESGRMTNGVRKVSARNPAGQLSDVRAESGKTSTGSHPIPSHPLPDQEKEPTLVDQGVNGAALALLPTEPAVTKADLESAYQAYPRKEGKTDGLKRLGAQVRTRAQLLELQKAISNFASQMRAEARPDDKIKIFSSFTSEWRDWIEWQVKAPIAPRASVGQRPVGDFPPGLTIYTKDGVTRE